MMNSAKEYDNDLNERFVSEQLSRHDSMMEIVDAAVEKRTKDLALQAATLTTLLDTIPGLVFSKNLDSQYMSCNKAFLDYFGLRMEDVYGKTSAQVIEVSAEISARHIEQDRIIINEGKTITSEELIPGADGVSRLFETTKTPLKLDDTVVGIICIAYDITRLKEVELELRMAHDEVQKASKAKSEFLANISHEIRTPMSSILGVIEILAQNEQLPGAIREGLDRISNSCNLLLYIINDILDLSKIEAGKLDVFPTPYNIANMINDSIQLNIVRLKGKSIKFILNIDENIPVNLIGDDLRIKQIISNLLSNAINYTDEGEITLSVSFEPEPENEEITLILRLQDTGRGMTEEQLTNLFKEYYRFDQIPRITVQGTGLGLAITQRLIELMNGDIKVESNVGVGSVFIVRLPQETINSEILGRDLAESLSSFTFTTSAGADRRRVIRDIMPYGNVLIVDDLETNLYVAVGLMNIFKLQVDTAESGQEAIDKIKNGKVYDIIFMDHMMPELDGIETVKHLRDLGYDKPVIAMTANIATGLSDVFLQNGFDGYLAKPIDIRRLTSILNKFVRDKQPPEITMNVRLMQSIGINEDEADSDRDTIASAQTGTDLTDTEIRGLDIKKGLRRYNGDKKTYIEILRSYAVSTKSMLSALETVSDEKLPDYKIKIHGIKGASNDIFATQIGAGAKALEDAANSGDVSYVLQNTPAFIDATRTLVCDIENMLTSIEAKFPRSNKDKPDDELLEKLLVACKAYDMDDVDSLMAEMDKYNYTSDDGLSDWLREKAILMRYSDIVKKLTDQFS